MNDRPNRHGRGDRNRSRRRGLVNSARQGTLDLSVIDPDPQGGESLSGQEATEQTRSEQGEAHTQHPSERDTTATAPQHFRAATFDLSANGDTSRPNATTFTPYEDDDYPRNPDLDDLARWVANNQRLFAPGGRGSEADPEEATESHGTEETEPAQQETTRHHQATTKDDEDDQNDAE